MNRLNVIKRLLSTKVVSNYTTHEISTKVTHIFKTLVKQLQVSLNYQLHKMLDNVYILKYMHL